MTDPRPAIRLWPLTVVAVLVLLGHVCESPIDALIVAHPSDAAHDGDSVDAGSCDAVSDVGGGTTPAPSIARAEPSSDDVVRATVFRPHTARATACAASPPPLFLLHATLLI